MKKNYTSPEASLLIYTQEDILVTSVDIEDKPTLPELVSEEISEWNDAWSAYFG